MPSHGLTLFTELKPLDDMVLIEEHLLESRVYRGIWNLAKVRLSVPFLTRFLKLIFMPLVGSFNVFPNRRQLNLLLSPPPSPTRPPIQGSAHRR